MEKRKLLFFSSSILTATVIMFILLDFAYYFNVDTVWRIYLIVIPIFGVWICNVIYKKGNKSGIVCNDYSRECLISSSLLIACLEYLFFLMIDKIIIDYRIQIFITEFAIVVILFYIKFSNKVENDEHKEDVNLYRRNFFSIYYINMDKVYEIAMLLNNKIATNICNEYEKTNMSILDNTANLSTKSIPMNLEYKLGQQYQNTEKNKVLENFDVKTTKSNLLDLIIDKAKVYDDKANLKPGDLVIFRNSKLQLLNQDETLRINKMLMNGAFNDSRITSGSNEMNIEMSISALINSLLKDCSYEVGCDINNEKFYFTIPMTFENDFESSYNIYDLLVGKVTLIGIYRGKENTLKRGSMFEFFSASKNSNSYSHPDNYNLTSSIARNINNGDDIESITNYDEQVDIIAVIQDINSMK